MFHQFSHKLEMPGIMDQGKHSYSDTPSDISRAAHQSATTQIMSQGTVSSLCFTSIAPPRPPLHYPFCSTSIHPCSSGSSRHLSINLSSSLVGRVSSSPYQRHSPHRHGSAQHCQSSRTRRNQQSVHTRTLVRQPAVGQRSHGPQHKYT